MPHSPARDTSRGLFRSRQRAALMECGRLDRCNGPRACGGSCAFTWGVVARGPARVGQRTIQPGPRSTLPQAMLFLPRWGVTASRDHGALPWLPHAGSAWGQFAASRVHGSLRHDTGFAPRADAKRASRRSDRWALAAHGRRRPGRRSGIAAKQEQCGLLLPARRDTTR